MVLPSLRSELRTAGSSSVVSEGASYLLSRGWCGILIDPRPQLETVTPSDDSRTSGANLQLRPPPVTGGMKHCDVP